MEGLDCARLLVEEWTSHHQYTGKEGGPLEGNPGGQRKARYQPGGRGENSFSRVSCGEVVYYESIKREVKIRSIYECRCDERLQTKTKEFTRLGYTGLVLELEHLKIETRLINDKFANAMGECEM